MKILPPEPQVELYSEGFEDNDILQRAQIGKSLSGLLCRIDDPLVVALDGPWGAGKTYFLKRWVGAHSIEHGSTSTVVYFDAFANDYLSDPLPALIWALASRLPPDQSTLVERAKSAAAKLIKPLARTGLALATFGATEALSDLGDVVVKSASSEAEAALNQYWKDEELRHSAMDDFRRAIEALAAPQDSSQTGPTMLIVIDELDRCRPDYALEILEVIKHFFSTPRIHFILGVNLDALENSVRARYGDRIDAEAYLRKFIQVKLELPSEIGDEYRPVPVVSVYLDHLAQEMGIPRHLSEPLREQIQLVQRSNPISIRDVGKILSELSLVSSEVVGNNRILSGWIGTMNDLIISKIVRPDIYRKLLKCDFELSDLHSFLSTDELSITPKVEGESNRYYDHKAFIRYYSWVFLRGDGATDGANEQATSGIASLFDGFGVPDNPRGIPMKIHRMWLDQFRLYSG